MSVCIFLYLIKFSESQERTRQQRYTLVSYNSIYSRHFSDTGQRVVCAKTSFLVPLCYRQLALACDACFHYSCDAIRTGKVEPLPTLPVAVALLLWCLRAMFPLQFICPCQWSQAMRSRFTVIWKPAFMQYVR